MWSHRFDQCLPEILILHRHFFRRPPAVGLPMLDPVVGKGFNDVLAVSQYIDDAWSADGAKAFQHRREFHPIIRGSRVAATEFFGLEASRRVDLEHSAPTARAGIVGTSPVGGQAHHIGIHQESSFGE
jgi:hypothetical protein